LAKKKVLQLIIEYNLFCCWIKFLRFGWFWLVLGFPIKLNKTNLSMVSEKMRKGFSVWAGSAVLGGFKRF
jgi:hypothetical protein